MGFGYVVVFIELLISKCKELYSSLPNSHILQFTIAYTKSSMSSRDVSRQRILTVSSASVLMFLPADYRLTTGPSLVIYWLWLTLILAVGSESELLYDWRFVANQVTLAPNLRSRVSGYKSRLMRSSGCLRVCLCVCAPSSQKNFVTPELIFIGVAMHAYHVPSKAISKPDFINPFHH
jgi:hypothetical protein